MSATFEPLRKGARQTVKEISFHFDIGVEAITKFKNIFINFTSMSIKNCKKKEK